MRRVVLVLSLVLLCCTLSAGAKSVPAPGVGDDKAAFLLSLQGPSPVLAAGHGGLPTKSTCTIHLTCDVGGYPLSCTSTSGDCHSGSTYVTCDGVQYNCPVCHQIKECCDGSYIECFGWTSCGFGGIRSVECDGEIQGTCPPISQCGP